MPPGHPDCAKVSNSAGTCLHSAQPAQAICWLLRGKVSSDLSRQRPAQTVVVEVGADGYGGAKLQQELT